MIEKTHLQSGLALLVRLDDLSKVLAVELRNRELVLGRLAGAVAAGNGTCTEWPSTVDLAETAELLGLEADGDVDDAVVREEGDGGECRGLLATVLGAGGDEDGRELLAL